MQARHGAARVIGSGLGWQVLVHIQKSNGKLHDKISKPYPATKGSAGIASCCYEIFMRYHVVVWKTNGPSGGTITKNRVKDFYILTNRSYKKYMTNQYHSKYECQANRSGEPYKTNFNDYIVVSLPGCSSLLC